MTEEEWEDKLAEVQRHSENWYEKYRSVQDLLAIENGKKYKIRKTDRENEVVPKL